MADNALTDIAGIRFALVNQRKALGLSQQDLADRLKISRVTVSRRETAESQPTAFELSLWCRALGLRLVTSLLPPPQSPEESVMKRAATGADAP